ncbi:hypothetical protein PUMCH_003905 [Australozyma saopauloensis]|uniref:Transmembrane protein n=1 Tax=Australozyma saopauloensis TaxID=291208 RepID=A0AAX4HF85_9ASCO|nr:hypothetical protein PUMCH_003905 [[Candida] saopauloensis]
MYCSRSFSSPKFSKAYNISSSLVNQIILSFVHKPQILFSHFHLKLRAYNWALPCPARSPSILQPYTLRTISTQYKFQNQFSTQFPTPIFMLLPLSLPLSLLALAPTSYPIYNGGYNAEPEIFQTKNIFTKIQKLQLHKPFQKKSQFHPFSTRFSSSFYSQPPYSRIRTRITLALLIFPHYKLESWKIHHKEKKKKFSIKHF